MRILLIEDEERIASFVRSGLEAEGFVVEHASNGVEGLELALELKPDRLIRFASVDKWRGRCATLRGP